MVKSIMAINSKMLPGAWSIGDILEKEGYTQELLVGSDSSFAGRGDYFAQHGNYIINDYNTALEDGRLPKDYHEWWGYEDRKLFAYAKEELLRPVKRGRAFQFDHADSGYPF